MKWNSVGSKGGRKNTQENKGECLKGQAAVRYIEHAVGKWRECIFACDILLRHATQSKTGHYADVRQLWQYNLYLSHFTCSALQSLYIQRELRSIQVYRLNIQLIKINEIYLEKNMLLRKLLIPARESTALTLTHTHLSQSAPKYTHTQMHLVFIHSPSLGFFTP